MFEGLNEKVKAQIEEILQRFPDQPVFDDEAFANRVSELLKQKLPAFLAAIILKALDEQMRKYGRNIPCEHFKGTSVCKMGKVVGEDCLGCEDYKPVRRGVNR